VKTGDKGVGMGLGKQVRKYLNLKKCVLLSFCIVFLSLLLSQASFGQENPSDKNDADVKQTLSIPYAFFNENFGFAVGYVHSVVGYPLVEKPGSDVMRIRTAITDLVPSNPALSGVTTVIPVGLAISAIKSGAGGGHTGVGEASMETEILDSTTNERIGVAVDTNPGGKLSGMTKWGAAKEAFKFWAKRLRTLLDEIHEK
jgi:hypothetical protein